MYPFLVENMADEEAHIQNLNIEVNSKEVCYFMCGENFGRILFEIFCVQITLKRNASSATAERLFHF